MGGESTLTLLERAKAGDRQAREVLYERCLLPLQRWAAGRLPGWARDAVDTDDLVQETVFRSIRRIEHFEPEHSGAFHAYLRQGVKNGIRDAIRRVQRRPRHDGTAGNLEDAAASPIEVAIGRQALDSYEEALAQLKETDREAIVARVELRLAYSQVALALDKPSPDAARMAVSRALLRLAEQMADAI